ncbi:DNA-directed RNA polymerase subunit omega [bacterium]|nr:DNA-directed RNA polymerase subunit omega [candidate division CSSED10-310 bacterium]
MKQSELEKFLNAMDSKYRAVLVAAKRAKQLQQGLRPLFEGKSTKATTMALEELINKKVEYYILEDSSTEQPEDSKTESQSASDSES